MNEFVALRAAAIVVLLGFSMLTSVHAGAPGLTIGYQPMVSTGLAAKQPFEAWFVFDKSSDPSVPGYAVPAGTTVRFTFPKEFTPLPGKPYLDGALLYGWPHGAIPAPFTLTQDQIDPRVVVVRIEHAISINPPERPGLKAIHVRTAELNPASAGNYSIAVEFSDAGALSGTTTAVAHITANPLPIVAAYNALHQGKDEDWQHVKAGVEAPLPIDFLVTLPDESRSSISLAATNNNALRILSDGHPIGLITTSGAPVTLTPQMFGPGLARLGIIEVHAKAGDTPGTAQITAVLEGGPQYKINLIIE